MFNSVTPWSAACQVPCSSSSPEVCTISCPLHWWCHPAISSSDALFSFCPQSFSASGTFPMSHLLASDDQNTRVSALASVLLMSTQGCFTLRLTGLDWILSIAYLWTSNVKNPCRRYKRCSLIPGSGRRFGAGHGNPFQYPCLENPMDRGAWWATVHRVTKELDTTEVI